MAIGGTFSHHGQSEAVLYVVAEPPEFDDRHWASGTSNPDLNREWPDRLALAANRPHGPKVSRSRTRRRPRPVANSRRPLRKSRDDDVLLP